MREEREEAVLELLDDGQPYTQAQIAEALSLPTATVSRYLRDLVSRRLVTVSPWPRQYRRATG